MAEEELLFIRNFYWILLALLAFQALIALCQYLSPQFPAKTWNKLLPVLLITYTSLYLGGRSIDIGGDTDIYWEFYEGLQATTNFWVYGEPVFYFFMLIFARLFTFEAFLTFCTFVYLTGAYIGMKRFFSSYAIYPLLLFLISPNFFLYGINCIRNGFAASVFLLSFYWWGKNNRKMYQMMFVSVLCHFSMLFPFLIFLFCKKYKSTISFLMIWTCMFMLYFSGFTVGAVLERILPDFGRINQYLSNQAEEPSTALINFFVYGASPVFAGIYYLYIKKYKDEMYLRLLNTYIITNSLYIGVMDIQFALRFAYLSEFLMPVVLIYPLIKERIWPLRFFTLSMVFISIFLIKATKILF